jgi:thiol-disulfide isomerase/thioredoxin
MVANTMEKNEKKNPRNSPLSRQRVRQALTIVLAFLAVNTMAQMPPGGKVKPVVMQPKENMQQAINTRTSDYATLKDEKNGQVVYKGIFSYHDMEQEPTFHWLVEGIENYKPDATATDYLKQVMGNYKLLIFIGTWCEDSQHLLPQLYKVLQTINMNWEDVMIVGMDRTKTTTTAEGEQLVKQYGITLLPTIIVLNSDGKETGRVIEAAQKSIEWDLTDIIGGRRK